MRRVVLAMLAAGCSNSAEAELEVDFFTSRGTITAVMLHAKAPKAVANLISLAEGNRSWVDPGTGQVRSARYFDGLPFHRVVKTPAVKLIETGSPLGVGTEGPGYTSPDEFDPSLTHEPYVLSMENTGPNTNGARFSFTGKVTLASRDGRNTVFGRVKSTASQSVIDAVLAAGAGATTIVDVQIRRTDPLAEAFDENAAELPTVWPGAAPLRVIPAVEVAWMGVQPEASVLRAHQSTNLKDWAPHYRHMLGLDDESPATGLPIDTADVTARFYHFSLATFPKAGGVTNLANRKLTIQSEGSGILIYRFNNSGTGGTYENILIAGEDPFLSGNFQVHSAIPATFEPYSFQILLYANGLGGAPFNLIRAGIDAIKSAKVTGRHVTTFSDPALNQVFEDGGLLELSRP